LEEYKADPSSKLDALIDILKYHQREPHLPVLENVENWKDYDEVDDEAYYVWTNALEPRDTYMEVAPAAKGTPDKVVVYQAFPSHNALVIPVSTLTWVILLSMLNNIHVAAALEWSQTICS
jgi:hypothetical protein